MSANIVLYCLDEVTDYAEFERLCSDLMVLEKYSSIEPLGGFKDKGRDAIHVNKARKTTIFAYSVREDWRAKLAEDASKIKTHGHTCNNLVFITTAPFTSGERDEAVNFIRNRYGWNLELFGRERLRILLEIKHPQVKKNYPQIFPPDFFVAEEKNISEKSITHVLIHYANQDRALGDWLTRKLTAEGYQIWSSGIKILGEDKYPQDIDDAIKNHVARVIAIYSENSLTNQELMRQRNIMLTLMQGENRKFLIPINVENMDVRELDKITSNLEFISFENGWVNGFKELLSNLETTNTPKPLLNGRTIAASTFFEQDILSKQSEQLVSNCLTIERIPNVVYHFSSEVSIQSEALEKIQFEWAFKKITPNLFLSFHTPSERLMNEYNLEHYDTVSWRDMESIDGIRTSYIISELLRKALLVKFCQKGLKYDNASYLSYFPQGLIPNDRLKYFKTDGKSSTVNSAGQRKYWKPSGADEYKYHLAPVFTIKQNLINEYIVLVRIRVMLMDTANNPLPNRQAKSRRKHLCKDWWNNDWLNRMLAVCQFFAEKGKIIIGTVKDEMIIINANPLIMNSPIGVNERALNTQSYERDETKDDDEIETSELEKRNE